MNNVEPQIKKNQTETNPTYLPLFSEDVLFQAADNVAQQNEGKPARDIAGKESGINLDKDSHPEQAVAAGAENVVPPNSENVETHTNQQTVESNLQGAVDVKKLPEKTTHKKKKKTAKKVKSQKRLVVAAKVFMSPDEKLHFEALAKENSQSFSNYVRLHLGLNPNKRGRTGRNEVAKIDLGLDDSAEDEQ